MQARDTSLAIAAGGDPVSPRDYDSGQRVEGLHVEARACAEEAEPKFTGGNMEKTSYTKVKGDELPEGLCRYFSENILKAKDAWISENGKEVKYAVSIRDYTDLIGGEVRMARRGFDVRITTVGITYARDFKEGRVVVSRTFIASHEELNRFHVAIYLK